MCARLRGPSSPLTRCRRRGSSRRLTRAARWTTMAHVRIFSLVALVGILATGCASAPPTASPAAPDQAKPEPAKTLVVLVRAEQPGLNPKPFRRLGLTADLAGRMFNAGLTIRNDA